MMRDAYLALSNIVRKRREIDLRTTRTHISVATPPHQHNRADRCWMFALHIRVHVIDAQRLRRARARLFTFN
jgi:hypothetical protein